MRQGTLRFKGTCKYRWRHLACTVVTDSIVSVSLWANSMATCHPGKEQRSFYYPWISSYLHSEGSSATFFVRSFRLFALPHISYNLTFPTRTVSLFTVCESSFSMLHKLESIDNESYFWGTTKTQIYHKYFTILSLYSLVIKESKDRSRSRENLSH